MPSQLTVTAKTGAGITVTSLVLGNLAWILFDLVKGVVSCGQDGDVPLSGEVKEYDLTGVTTVTCTVSGRNYTWLIS